MTSSSTRSSRGSDSEVSQPNALTAAVEEVRAVDDSRSRLTRGASEVLRPRSDTVFATLYVIGVATWLLLAPPSHLALGALLACVAALAVTSSIEFEVGPGSVTPTAAVFVACLFLLRGPLIPVAAICGGVASAAIGRLRDRSRRDRLSVLVGSAFFAVGPALVFSLASAGAHAPRLRDWPVYVLAGVAQFAFDATATWFLNCYRLGIPVSVLVPALRFTYLVDLLLIPIGYAIAFVVAGSPVGLLFFVPLLALLTVLQGDRTRQLDRAIALATHDPLTGLPNRTLFNERLEDRLADEQPVTVALIDLDGFKEVNDTLGHALGDALLVEVGRRLSPRLPAPDLIARLGGDEFAVLLSVADEADAMRRVDELLACIRLPFRIAELDFDIDASIGVAIADDPSLSGADLIRRADVAMYTAKEDRIGRACYSLERDHYSAERLALAGRLRRGIAAGELELYFQPQVDLMTGETVGAEALLRWNCPGRGLVSPDEFIPVAERTELIRPLTAFVFTAAIKQAAAWRRAGYELNVSVNLSPRNLVEDDLVESIAHQLMLHDLSPSALTVEVTETAVMANPVRAAEIMRRLRAIGLEISIDDFGTGHSSLAYLTTLPQDELKIDRSFIQALTADENAEAVVRAIVDLARRLRLVTVAEGVETVDDLALLREIGCSAGQGYLFSKPITAAAMTAWMEAGGAREHFESRRDGSKRALTSS